MSLKQGSTEVSVLTYYKLELLDLWGKFPEIELLNHSTFLEQCLFPCICISGWTDWLIFFPPSFGVSKQVKPSAPEAQVQEMLRLWRSRLLGVRCLPDLPGPAFPNACKVWEEAWRLWVCRELSKTCLRKSSNTSYMEPDMVHTLEDMCMLRDIIMDGTFPGRWGISAAKGPKTVASLALSNRIRRPAGNECSSC